MYFAALKREHVLQASAIKDAIRSCIWGIGADKQCPALDLRQLEGMKEVEPVDDGPRRTVDTVILFTLFACREMEAALRKLKRVQVEETGVGCGVVSLYLPASKTDSKGEGVLRKQGCLCETMPSLCPVAAAKRLMQAAVENGHQDDDPLLVTDKPTKQGMVKAFRRVAVSVAGAHGGGGAECHGAHAPTDGCAVHGAQGRRQDPALLQVGE